LTWLVESSWELLASDTVLQAFGKLKRYQYKRDVTTVNALPYNIVTTDDYIHVNGSWNVVLPAITANDIGRVYTIYVWEWHNITVTWTWDLIDYQVSQIVNEYESVSLIARAIWFRDIF